MNALDIGNASVAVAVFKFLDVFPGVDSNETSRVAALLSNEMKLDKELALALHGDGVTAHGKSLYIGNNGHFKVKNKQDK